MERLAPNSGMPKLRGEPASGATSPDQRLSTTPSLRLFWGIDDQSGRNPRVLLLRNRPGLAEPLPGSVGRRANLGRFQRVGGDRQSSSQRIEKYDKRLAPPVGGCGTKLY